MMAASSSGVPVIEILLAFISIGVTVISIVLGYILRHFLPMKNRINTLWHVVLGVPEDETDKGLKQSAAEEREDLRDLIESSREEQNEAHEEVKEEFQGIRRYLQDLAGSLREEGIDVPEPEEELQDTPYGIDDD